MDEAEVHLPKILKFALPQGSNAVSPREPLAGVAARQSRGKVSVIAHRGCKWDEYLAFLRQAADGIVVKDNDGGFSRWQARLLSDVRAAVDPIRFAEDTKMLDDKIDQLRLDLKEAIGATSMQNDDADDVSQDVREKQFYDRTQLVTEIGWTRTVKRRMAAELRRENAIRQEQICETNVEVLKPGSLLNQLGLTSALERARASYNQARKEALKNLQCNVQLQKQCSLVYHRVHTIEAELDAHVHSLRAFETRAHLTKQFIETDIHARECSRRNRTATIQKQARIVALRSELASERARKEAFESGMSSTEKIVQVLLHHLYQQCTPVYDTFNSAVGQLQRKLNTRKEAAAAAQKERNADAAARLRKEEEALAHAKRTAASEIAGLELEHMELLKQSIESDPSLQAIADLNGAYLWISLDASSCDDPRLSERNLLWLLSHALGVDMRHLSLLSVTMNRPAFGPPDPYTTLPILQHDQPNMCEASVAVHSCSGRVEACLALGKALHAHPLLLDMHVSRGTRTITGGEPVALVKGHFFEEVDSMAIVSVRFSAWPPSLIFTCTITGATAEDGTYALVLHKSEIESLLGIQNDLDGMTQRALHALVDTLLPFLSIRHAGNQVVFAAVQTFQRDYRHPHWDEAKVVIRTPAASDPPCSLYERLFRIQDGYVLLRFSRQRTYTLTIHYKHESKQLSPVVLEIRPGASMSSITLAADTVVEVHTSFGVVQVRLSCGGVVGTCFGWDGVEQRMRPLVHERLVNMRLQPVQGTTKRLSRLDDDSRRSRRRSSHRAPLMVEREVSCLEWRLPGRLLWRTARLVSDSYSIVSCFTDNFHLYRLQVYTPISKHSVQALCCTNPYPYLDSISTKDGLTIGTPPGSIHLGWQPSVPTPAYHRFEVAGRQWEYLGKGILRVEGQHFVANGADTKCAVVAFGWTGTHDLYETKLQVLVVRKQTKTLVHIDLEGDGYKMAIEEDNADVVMDIPDIGRMFALSTSLKCKPLPQGSQPIGIGSVSNSVLTSGSVHILSMTGLTAYGDCVACFMPRNCSDVKEQCVVMMRHGKDLLWKLGSSAWGRKPKKIPLRKLLKEMEAKLAAAPSDTGRELMHRVTRFLPCLQYFGANTGGSGFPESKTFFWKLDHPVLTKFGQSVHQATISIFRCRYTADTDTDIFCLELTNAETTRWTQLPGWYEGEDITGAMYVSPAGDIFYIIGDEDAEDADGPEVRRFTTTTDNITYATNLRVTIPPKEFDLHEDELRNWLVRFEGEAIEITEHRSRGKRSKKAEGELNGKELVVGLHLLDPTMEVALVNWVASKARLDENMELTFE